jgi:uncharacterized protein (DUF58 family)
MTDQRWLPLLGLAFILGVFIRSPILITFSVSLVLVVVVSLWWRKHALDGVIYRRRWHFRRLFPGETTSLHLEIENRKLLPVTWLRTVDAWSEAVGPVDPAVLAPSHLEGVGNLTHIFSLRWYERMHREYSLLFRKRGIYPVGPVLLESGDLFGIYEKQLETGPVEYLTVFPTMLPLPTLEFPSETPFGDRRGRRRIYEDPNRPIGIREYRPGDDFRRIHWPATARTGEIQVKVYQPVTSQVLAICLNVSTFQHYWEGVYPDLLERLISVAATVINQGVEAGYAVGLVSNGHLVHSDQPFRIPPSRSPHQLARLLEALAGVTPFTVTSFERYLLKSAPSIPFGATLLIVTALFSPELTEVLLRLKPYRLHMAVISLAKDPPPEIPGIKMIHLPFQIP